MADKESGLRRAGAKTGEVVRTVVRNLPPVLIAKGLVDAAQATQRGAADFWEGAAELPAGTIPRVGGASAAAAAAPAKSQAKNAPKWVDAPAARMLQAMDAISMHAAAAKNVQPSPQERAMALADSVLREPTSLYEAKSALGLLPAPQKPQTNADRLIGETAALAQQRHSLALQAIKAQEAAGKITSEQASAARDNVSKDLFDQWLSLTKGNPLNVAQAGLLDGAEGN